ncbi:MAG: NusG-II domain-containing protein [Eubacteriales bacterium]|jgi:hypothetical protein
MKKNILCFLLWLTLTVSILLNLYFLIPKNVSESISTGYYLSRDANGISYKLSIMEDNRVLLYGPKDNLLYTGNLEFNKNGNDYLIVTDTNVFQVAARDDTIFLPIIENKRIISKLFRKVDSASVTYGSDEA